MNLNLRIIFSMIGLAGMHVVWYLLFNSPLFEGGLPFINWWSFITGIAVSLIIFTWLSLDKHDAKEVKNES